SPVLSASWRYQCLPHRSVAQAVYATTAQFAAVHAARWHPGRAAPAARGHRRVPGHCPWGAGVAGSHTGARQRAAGPGHLPAVAGARRLAGLDGGPGLPRGAAADGHFRRAPRGRASGSLRPQGGRGDTPGTGRPIGLCHAVASGPSGWRAVASPTSGLAALGGGAGQLHLRGRLRQRVPLYRQADSGVALDAGCRAIGDPRRYLQQVAVSIGSPGLSGGARASDRELHPCSSADVAARQQPGPGRAGRLHSRGTFRPPRATHAQDLCVAGRRLRRGGAQALAGSDRGTGNSCRYGYRLPPAGRERAGRFRAFAGCRYRCAAAEELLRQSQGSGRSDRFCALRGEGNRRGCQGSRPRLARLSESCPGPAPGQRPSEDAQWVFDERPNLVEIRPYVGAGAVDGVAQAQVQILGRTTLDGVADLVEDLALGAVVVVASIDVVTAYIGELVAQTRHAVLGEVQLVAGLPGALVLQVEVRVVGVGQVDAGTAITVVIGETGVAAVALMGDDERMGADAVLGGQAPDSVAIALAVTAQLHCGHRVGVVLGAVDVEVEVQRLIGSQCQVVIDVGVIALVHVFEVG